jgi:CBS domain containing-hemolysin-like protein
MVGVGLVLTLGTGVFVAAEFALVNLDRGELERRRDSGEHGLHTVIQTLHGTSTQLSGAQLGITVTTLLAGYAFEPALAGLVSTAAGAIRLPQNVATAVGGVLGVGIATVISMVVGELVPKNFAIAVPVRTARLVIPMLSKFTAVCKPVVAVLNGTSNMIVRRLGVQPQEELSRARTAQELASLMRRSAERGTLEPDHAALLGRSLRFSDRAANDVMTPRAQLQTVSSADSAQTVVQLSQDTGISRFPVRGASIDDIAGLAHVKDAYAVALADRDQTAAATFARPPLQVPDTLGVDLLLAQLRQADFQAAIVVDEYGGTAGLVTIEDLVEELIGELADEHDQETPRVIRDGEELVIDASLRPDELLARCGVRVPEDDAYETIAGYVTERLGRIARPGDEVVTDDGVFWVVSLAERRIDWVRYLPIDPDAPAWTQGQP